MHLACVWVIQVKKIRSRASGVLLMYRKPRSQGVVSVLGRFLPFEGKNTTVVPSPSRPPSFAHVLGTPVAVAHDSVPSHLESGPRYDVCVQYTGDCAMPAGVIGHDGACKGGLTVLCVAGSVMVRSFVPTDYSVSRPLPSSHGSVCYVGGGGGGGREVGHLSGLMTEWEYWLDEGSFFAHGIKNW